MKTIDNQILLYNKIGNSIIVSLNTNRLNVINSKEIENELLQLVKSGEISIHLDFSEIEFIDSAGFQSLLSVFIDSKLHHAEFRIINVKPKVLELFKLVELDDIFDLKINQNNYRKAS